MGRFGAAWFGWDAERGVDRPGLTLAGLTRDREALVAAPRRYGFHATLKAPFRLVDGAAVEALDRAVAALAAGHVPFTVPLQLNALGGFLALTPRHDVPALGAVAAACVTGLDGFRAPLRPEEIARRRAAGLTLREAEHLLRWGYPHVLEHFTFHLTLTGPLAPGDRAAAAGVLGAALGPILAAPMAFQDLCLFGEAADGRFHVVSRHALGTEVEG